jgi:hypothetical protein
MGAGLLQKCPEIAGEAPYEFAKLRNESDPFNVSDSRVRMLDSG